MVSLDGHWGWALTLLFGQTHWCGLHGASSARLGFFCRGITPADLGCAGFKANPDLQTTEPGSEGWELKLLSPVCLSQLQAQRDQKSLWGAPRAGAGAEAHQWLCRASSAPVSPLCHRGLAMCTAIQMLPSHHTHMPGSTRACSCWGIAASVSVLRAVLQSS